MTPHLPLWVSGVSSSLSEYQESTLVGISLSDYHESPLVSRFSSSLSESDDFPLASIVSLSLMSLQ